MIFSYLRLLVGTTSSSAPLTRAAANPVSIVTIPIDTPACCQVGPAQFVEPLGQLPTKSYTLNTLAIIIMNPSTARSPLPRRNLFVMRWVTYFIYLYNKWLPRNYKETLRAIVSPYGGGTAPSSASRFWFLFKPHNATLMKL